MTRDQHDLDDLRIVEVETRSNRSHTVDIPNGYSANGSKDEARRPLLTGDSSDDENAEKNELALEAARKLDSQPSREETARRQTTWQVGVQVFFPFLMAGFGTVGAGVLLDYVQHWNVFKEVDQLFVLVPALLGLKGNLEMTLASRLSTQANLGSMDSRKTALKLCGGNLALAQTQALVVALLASVVAISLGWVKEGVDKYFWEHGAILIASALFTASLASLALGLVMCAVVYFSHLVRIDPDNVATPIAASLGDITTLALLSESAAFLHSHNSTSNHWVAPLIAVCFLLTVPVWWTLAKRNTFTVDVLHTGWTPVLLAMCISSAGGFILDFVVASFEGIAIFTPVINGVGGNLVAVQASRLSTRLHQTSQIGDPSCRPENESCCGTFRGHSLSSKTARLLLFLVFPGHLIFLVFISYLKAGHTSLTMYFSVGYLIAATLQVVILLLVANWLVHWLWRRGKDPDNNAIPYLTALGDLLGTGLLAIAFLILYWMGDRDKDIGD